MATSDVQILGSWASPYATRVSMALKLKSVDYEFIEENFYTNKSNRLLKANPIYKKIPVLIHGQKSICESLVILEYIDDAWTHGPSILPSDPFDRATTRFWAAYIDQTWFPLLKALQNASTDDAKATIMGKIYEGLFLLEEALVKCSKGKPFFGGENVGYIDIVLGSYLGWFKVVESMVGLKLIHETTIPGLARWAEKFGSHEAAKDFIQDPQKLLEFFMMVQAAKASS